jgi:hypothetical protein
MGRAAGAVLVAVIPMALLGACGDDDDGTQRAGQVSEAASDAGLPEDVADLLALLARGTTADYQVVYPGDDGTSELVVTQRAPDRRVDRVEGTDVVSSTLLRDGIRYECRPDDTGDLLCDRAGTDADDAGPFDIERLERAVDAISDSAADYDLRVVEREVLDVSARCLVAERREDAPPDTGSAGLGELCLSPEGAVLVAASGGERVEATEYTTEIPDGIFDLPDGAAG